MVPVLLLPATAFGRRELFKMLLHLGDAEPLAAEELEDVDAGSSWRGGGSARRGLERRGGGRVGAAAATTTSAAVGPRAASHDDDDPESVETEAVRLLLLLLFLSSVIVQHLECSLRSSIVTPMTSPQRRHSMVASGCHSWTILHCSLLP